MRFHIPRHYRRPLFFPPGLLALAGLLWLGTSLLIAHPGQLKVQNVMQWTVPALNPTPQEAKAVSAWPLKLSPAKLDKFRPWHDVYFRGSPKYDLLEQEIATCAVDEILEDYIHQGGVRIRFAQKANYEQLVFALDLMQREGVPRYWLDMRRSPTTLYGFTNGYKSRTTTPRNYGEVTLFENGVWRHGHFSGCFFIADTPPALPPKFWDLIRLQAAQPQWRTSLWLLAAIAVFNLWRMARSWLRPDYSA